MDKEKNIDLMEMKLEMEEEKEQYITKTDDILKKMKQRIINMEQ